MNTNEPIRGAAHAAYLAEQKHWCPETLERCRAWLKDLDRFLARHGQSWDQADAQILKQFESHLQWNSGRCGLYAANTIYQALRMIRSFYRWAKEREMVESDPTAGWILPRPRAGEDRLLTQVEVQKLFNLPDLAKPIGQRDVLLLALIYHGGYSLNRCLELRCDGLRFHADQDSVLNTAYERYFQQGRSFQATQPQEILLLTNRGIPVQSQVCLQERLKRLGQQIGHDKLSARILRKSRKAHEHELSQRHAELK